MSQLVGILLPPSLSLSLSRTSAITKHEKLPRFLGQTVPRSNNYPKKIDGEVILQNEFLLSEFFRKIHEEKMKRKKIRR